MPKPGWSNETLIKPEIITEIGHLQLSIIEQIHSHKRGKYGGLSAKFPFTYLDLTAGPGLCEDGTHGVAMRFHSLLEQSSFAYQMHLIEETIETFQKLHICFDGRPSVNCYLGRSELIAPQILNRLSYKPFGLICLDPNGCNARDEALIKAVAACPQAARMDWLIHIGTRTIKRVRQVRDFKFKPELMNLLSLIGKKHGLVKRSPSQTKQDWLYIFLTNAAIGQWKRQFWYDMSESIEGRQIVREANYTIAELRAMQPKLFPEFDENIADQIIEDWQYEADHDGRSRYDDPYWEEDYDDDEYRG